MKRWLARLTFSFFILAAAALYESRHAAARGHDRRLYYLAATALTIAAIAGLRERHRRDL
jgi:hypothetical protein